MSAAVHDEGRYPKPVHEKSKGYHSVARDYVAGRPGYPSIEWLRDVLGVAPGKKIAEIGAGTGKFIPTLKEAGGTITAVEPITDKRERLVQFFSDMTALAGSADAIPLPDAAIDAVTCAQAFHWFANVKAVAEMRRVLVRGGRLGLVGNGQDKGVPWVAALSQITDRREGDTPRYRTGAWRTAFPTPGFELIGDRHV